MNMLYSLRRFNESEVAQEKMRIINKSQGLKRHMEYLIEDGGMSAKVINLYILEFPEFFMW